jgi:hypothetical protein
MAIPYTITDNPVLPHDLLSSWYLTSPGGPRESVRRRVVLLPGNEAGGWPSGGGESGGRAVGNREPPGNGTTRMSTGFQRPQATFRLTKGRRNVDSTG